MSVVSFSRFHAMSRSARRAAESTQERSSFATHGGSMRDSCASRLSSALDFPSIHLKRQAFPMLFSLLSPAVVSIRHRRSAKRGAQRPQCNFRRCTSNRHGGSPPSWFCLCTHSSPRSLRARRPCSAAAIRLAASSTFSQILLRCATRESISCTYLLRQSAWSSTASARRFYLRLGLCSRRVIAKRQRAAKWRATVSVALRG